MPSARVKLPGFGEHYPPQLIDLAEQVCLKLTLDGVEPERAARIGVEVAEHIRLHWGGTKVYFNKGRRFELTRRDAEILARYDGRNRRALAREYHLSLPRLDQIIAAGRAAAKRSRYNPLPDPAPARP